MCEYSPYSFTFLTNKQLMVLRRTVIIAQQFTEVLRFFSLSLGIVIFFVSFPGALQFI